MEEKSGRRHSGPLWVRDRLARGPWDSPTEPPPGARGLGTALTCEVLQRHTCRAEAAAAKRQMVPAQGSGPGLPRAALFPRPPPASL